MREIIITIKQSYCGSDFINAEDYSRKRKMLILTYIDHIGYCSHSKKHLPSAKFQMHDDESVAFYTEYLHSKANQCLVEEHITQTGISF